MEGEPFSGLAFGFFGTLTRECQLIRRRKSAGRPAELGLAEERQPLPDLSPL
jgi:hypothetical protein